MPAELEIILPIRNPTAVLAKTVESLAAQTDRSFRILLSDNHSTAGGEHLEAALKTLADAGLAVRLVKPGIELGRVEHWNWAHFQSSAAWLKPLFAGDWLDAEYIGAVRREIEAAPQCRYVYSNFNFHDAAAGTTHTVGSPWVGSYRPPTEMRDVVLRYGLQFGPPSVAAYQRDIFIALGGYRTTLPICADSLLFCGLAARFGATGIGRPLSNFQLHGARFSTALPGRQAAIFREKIIYLTLLVYHAWADEFRLPKRGIFRLFAREIRQRVRELASRRTA